MSDELSDERAWLLRLGAEEWVRAGLAELSRTAAASDPRALAAGAKRAAGMGLNGVLRVAFRAAWGQSYVEHLRAAAEDDEVPDLVRERCRRILAAKAPAGPIVPLRSKRAETELVEAVKDVLAWSYGEIVKRQSPPEDVTE